MASLINFSINLDQIPENKKEAHPKGNFVKITLRVKDTVDNYGQNVKSQISQSKEERDDKNQPPVWLGDGRVVWTDGKITKAEVNKPVETNQNLNDLDSILG